MSVSKSVIWQEQGDIMTLFGKRLCRYNEVKDLETSSSWITWVGSKCNDRSRKVSFLEPCLTLILDFRTQELCENMPLLI